MGRSLNDQRGFSALQIFAICAGNWLGILISGTTLAQVLPDQSLGQESSRVVSSDRNIDQIEAGAIRGSNLFHSFEAFNVGSGRAVYFDQPASVENIFSRVTGNARSEIFGTLGVLGDANLFFLNPNGIIFGPDAQLDISGSFVGTTATGFEFEDGLGFSAVEAQAAPLLNVSVVLGLQFGTQPGGTISNRGRLAVGQDFRLEANELDLQGQLQSGGDLTLRAVDEVRVRDTVAEPFLAVAGGQLLVQGDRSIDIFALNHPESGLYSGGDMVLRSDSSVGGDAHYWSSGNFAVEKLDRKRGSLFSPKDPIIRSIGDVIFFAYQGASLHILAGGKVDINTVIITNPDETATSINSISTPALSRLNLSDGTSLVVNGNQQATVDIRAGVLPQELGTPLGSTSSPSNIFFDSSLLPIDAPEIKTIASDASITLGDLRIVDSNGIALITNQYRPNLSLTNGDIAINGNGLLGVGINTTSLDGDGGSIFLDSRNDIIVNAGIDASSFGESGIFMGNGGDISLLAKGNININSGNSVFSLGLLGGSLTLKSGADIIIDNSFVDSVNFKSGSQETGGNITLKAMSLFLRNGGELGTFTLGSVNAGNILIQADEVISIDGEGFLTGIGSQALADSTGDGGKVRVEAPSLVLTRGGQIVTSTLGSGRSGQLNVVSNEISIVGRALDGDIPSGIGTSTEQGSTGVGGNLVIQTDSLRIVDGAQVVSSTTGDGKAGNLEIKAKDIAVIGTSLNSPSGKSASIIDSGVEPGANGSGGNLNIETETLLVASGGNISTSTSGAGKAGDLIIRSENIRIDGFSIEGESSIIGAGVEREASGAGGDLSLDTKFLHLTNGGQLAVGTFSSGNSGNLDIAAQSIEISGEGPKGASSLSAAVQQGAAGNSGAVRIRTEELFVADGAGVSVSTRGTGNAGNLTISAQIIKLSGTGMPSTNEIFPSGLFANTKGSGNAGRIDVQADQVFIQERAQISAATTGNGTGGDITLTAKDLVVSGGGKIRATTNGQQRAGSININIQSNTLLSGVETGIFAETTDSSSGNGGDIFISSKDLIVIDKSSILVDSNGKGTGGEVQVLAEFLDLNNGEISAKTRSSEGGNIALNIQEPLLIRNASQISTNAGNQKFGGDGGSIFIDTPFLIALPNENSDIIANAFSGAGGQITINAQGIFNFDITDGQNQTQLRQNTTNDISASSETGTSGTITLNTPDVDPSRGLAELPTNLIDPANQIAQSCAAQIVDGASSFVITGRGGLPVRPGGAIAAEYSTGSIRSLNSEDATPIEVDARSKHTDDRLHLFQEASAWNVTEQGQIQLIAGQSISPSTPSCTS